MKIIIGSDHRGFVLKDLITSKLCDIMLNNEREAITWHDVGCDTSERCDYPVYAQKACRAILDGVAEYAVLICGSGVGMAIAANRFTKIYAALCWSPKVAQLAHSDDNANVLVLSADLVSGNDNMAIVQAMIEAWVHKTFKGGHYQERLDMMDVSN